uniref:Uncharacterized protein n=1 Tax=Arcella intermedia TaxID=1963864 RepID=A0A6B2LJ34_9EUKA
MGLTGAGKTSLLHRITHPNKVPAVSPTETYEEINFTSNRVFFNCWDVSGTEIGISLWPNYFHGGGVDAIVWVVDSSSSKLVKNSYSHLQKILLDPQLVSVPLFVVANKQDVDGAMGPEEVAKKLKLQSNDGKRLWRCLGVSTLNGEGVKELKRVLVKDMKAKLTGKTLAPGVEEVPKEDLCACCTGCCGGEVNYV